jgi:hypothetical protein
MSFKYGFQKLSFNPSASRELAAPDINNKDA